jgi:hypothetical protein
MGFMRARGTSLPAELITAYRAVRPVLVRAQRPWRGGIASLLVATASGFGLGYFTGEKGLFHATLMAPILGVLAGGVFRWLGRPIESKWRWLAVTAALLGWVIYNLTWSYLATDGAPLEAALTPIGGPGTRIGAPYGFTGILDLVGFTLAGWSAWFTAHRMPTQGEIIQRALRHATLSPSGRR